MGGCLARQMRVLAEDKIKPNDLVPPSPVFLTGHASHPEPNLILQQFRFHTAYLCVRDVSADHPVAAYRAPARRRLDGLARLKGQLLFGGVERTRSPSTMRARPKAVCLILSQFGSSCKRKHIIPQSERENEGKGACFARRCSS